MFYKTLTKLRNMNKSSCFYADINENAKISNIANSATHDSAWFYVF